MINLSLTKGEVTALEGLLAREDWSSFRRVDIEHMKNVQAKIEAALIKESLADNH